MESRYSDLRLRLHIKFHGFFDYYTYVSLTSYEIKVAYAN